MATTFVLTRPDVFVSGTVSAYLKPALGVPASGAPSGSAVSAPSVVGNSVTFTGLADNTQYIAYQGSPDRYVSFRTAPAAAGGGAETDPVAGPDLATHAALTTAAHGGVVASGDSRLTDSRAPSGAAGGVLGGTYPNPSFAADMATQAELDTHAALIASHGRLSAVAGSDVPNSTTSYADVTGLGLAVVNGVTYVFQALLIWQSAATTTGSRFSVNGPTFTALGYEAAWPGTAGTTLTYQVTNVYDQPGSPSTGVGSANANYFARITGVVVPSADGTLIPRFSSEVAASAVTVKAGSVFQLWRAS